MPCLGHVADSKDYLSGSAVELINMSRKDGYILGFSRVRDRGGDYSDCTTVFHHVLHGPTRFSARAHVVLKGRRVFLEESYESDDY